MALVNDHRISLRDALVFPERLTVIVRTVKKGKVSDDEEDVWLVGREKEGDGYRIVMRERDCQFGLASKSFLQDRQLVLAGWYGTLKSAFLGM